MVVSVDFNRELKVALTILVVLSIVQIPSALVAFLQVELAAAFYYFNLTKLIYTEKK